MKLGTLAVHIAAFSRSLSRAEAPSHPAILDEFVKLLSGRDEATVAAFLKNATKNRAPKGVGIGPNASDVVPALSNLRDFSAEIGKKDVAESAGAIIEFLEERADMPLAAFNASHVVSASRRRNRTGAAHVDHALVADYLQRLDKALGKDDVFMALYRELQDDERVTKHEAVEIADRFMGPVAASTSRPKALERILYRHRKLMNFAAGSASIGGRSAA